MGKTIEKFLSNKKFKSVMKKFLFSRIALFAILLIVQLFLYLSFLLWLEPYIDVLLGSNIGIVLVFMD